MVVWILSPWFFAALMMTLCVALSLSRKFAEDTRPLRSSRNYVTKSTRPEFKVMHIDSYSAV